MPQIQNVKMDGSGRVTKKGWEVSAERPEIITEGPRGQNVKIHRRDEQEESHLIAEIPNMTKSNCDTRVGQDK